MTDLQTIARCDQLIRKSLRVQRLLIEEDNLGIRDPRFLAENDYREALRTEIMRCEDRMIGLGLFVSDDDCKGFGKNRWVPVVKEVA